MLNSNKQQIETIRKLTPNIPTNDFGLVTGFYRPDFITTLPTKQEYDTNTKEMDTAWTPLFYDGGYPVMPNGIPFWGQLDYESPDIFHMFTTYLQLPILVGSGVRVIGDLSDVLSRDNKNVHISTDTLQGHIHLYYWNQRAAAYDMFKVAAHRKQLEIRAINTQDNHYIEATNLLKRVHSYMQSDEDFWDLITPKLAIDFQKNLIHMQRISSGLPGAAPLQDQDRGGENIEVTMRQIAGKNMMGRKTLNRDEEHTIVLNKALEDEETAEMAQELVIKLNTK